MGIKKLQNLECIFLTCVCIFACDCTRISSVEMKKITSFYPKETKRVKSRTIETSSTESTATEHSRRSESISSNITEKVNSNLMNNLPEKPHQPRSFCFPSKDQGKQKRQFNPKWFD